MKHVTNYPPAISLAPTYEDARIKQLITLSSENVLFFSVASMNKKMNTKDPTISEMYESKTAKLYLGTTLNPFSSGYHSEILGRG